MTDRDRENREKKDKATFFLQKLGAFRIIRKSVKLLIRLSIKITIIG